MSNPIFDALGGGSPQGNIANQFKQFMTQMSGKNPNEEIDRLLRSGRISQQQLDEAQRMAQQMQGLFGGLRSLFRN
ncbi:MAG: hypothetical protein J6R01_08065 [Alistipes sp.]|nr:hypothetical protein [Alistipes sp.]